MVAKKAGNKDINNGNNMMYNGVELTKEQAELLEAADPSKRTDEVKIDVTPAERVHLEILADLLSKIDIQGHKMIPTNNIVDLIRVCIAYTIGVYQGQILGNSNLATTLKNKNDIKDFVAYRQKYMNFTVDAQLDDLRRIGVVKSKK